MATISSSISASGYDATETSGGTVTTTGTTGISFKTTAQKYFGFIIEDLPIFTNNYVHSAIFYVNVAGPTKTTFSFNIYISAKNFSSPPTVFSSTNKPSSYISGAGVVTASASITTDGNANSFFGIDVTSLLDSIKGNFSAAGGSTDFVVVLEATSTTDSKNVTLNLYDGGSAAYLTIQTAKTRTIATTGTAPLDWHTSATWGTLASKTSTMVPDQLDDVVAVAGSLSVSVSSGPAYCRSLNLTNYVNTLTLNNDIYIGINDAPVTRVISLQAGNIALKLVSGMTLNTSGFYMYLRHWTSTATTEQITTAQTIDTAGKTIPSDLIFSGGKYSFIDSGSITQTNATWSLSSSNINFNGKTFSLGRILASASSLTLGASSITLSGAGGSLNTFLDQTCALYIESDCTVSRGTSTIICTGTDAKVYSSQSLYILKFTGTGTAKLTSVSSNIEFQPYQTTFTGTKTINNTALGGTATYGSGCTANSTILIASIKCANSFSVSDASGTWTELVSSNYNGVYSGIYYKTYTVADAITITPTGGAAGEIYISGFDNLSPSFSSSDIIESATIQTVNEFQKIIKNDNFLPIDGGLYYFFNASSDSTTNSIANGLSGNANNPSIASKFFVTALINTILDSSASLNNKGTYIGWNSTSSDTTLTKNRIIYYLHLRPKPLDLYRLEVNGPSEFWSGCNLKITNLLTLQGTLTSRLAIKSSFDGYERRWTITGATTDVDNVDFQDQAFTPTSISYAGTGNSSFGNFGGNSGITFNPSATRYWVGGAGSWNSTTKWSTGSGGTSGASIPLAQDSVIFDNNSGSGAYTATVNMTAIPSVDTSAVTDGATTLTLTTTSSVNIFGDVILSSRSIIETTSLGVYYFAERSSDISPQIFNLNGGTNRIGIFGLSAYNGTLSITGSYSYTSTVFFIENGILKFNGNVTASRLVSNIDQENYGYNKKIIFASDSTFSLGGGADTQGTLDFQRIVPERNNVTINITNTGTAAKTIYIPSILDGTGIFKKILISGGGTGLVTLNPTYINRLTTDNDYQINELEIRTPKTVYFYNYITLNNFIANGTSANKINFNGNLRKTFGIVLVQNCIIGGGASGGASFYAANSTDSGTSGWVFTKVPYPGVLSLPQTQNPRNQVGIRSNFI